MPHTSPHHPPSPLLLIIEAYPGIRMAYPAFLDLYLKGTEALVVATIEDARAVLKNPERRNRVTAFITHGISGNRQVAREAVNLMDSLLGRPVPYVVLSGAPRSIATNDLPRPPIAIVEKGAKGSIPACLCQLQEHFGMQPMPSA